MMPDWVIYLVAWVLTPVLAITLLTARDAWKRQ